MFKKVQFRFVTITMSIILAIFIAVLGSINLIMQTVMQRQSKVILSKIATNIKYDEKTSVFSFVPEMNENKKPDKYGEKWEINPEMSESNHSDTTDYSSENYTSEESQTYNTDTDKFIYSDSPSTSYPEFNETPHPSDETTKIEQPKTEITQPVIIPEPTETIIQTNPPVPPSENPTTAFPIEPEWKEPPFYQPPWHEDNFQPNQPEEFIPEYNENFENHDKSEEYNEDFQQFPNKEDFHYNDYFYNEEYMHDAEPDDFDFYENNNSDKDLEEYESDDINKLQELSCNQFSILEDYYIKVTPLSNENLQPPDDIRKFDGIPPKTIDSIDYFVLMADSSGKFLDMLNQDEMDTSLAQRYINSILHDGSVTGMIGSLQFYTSQKENGTVMVFTDKSSEIEMLDKLIKTTLLIGSVSFVCLSILVVFLSRKSIEPVKQAFEKQKQFVSDASHELKTPLTIISANADVLAGEIGENKWLTYIQSQTERMSLLVNDLLNLTRLENNSSDMTFSEFNLSQAVMSSALPFECQAFEAGKTLEVHVDEGMMLTASERHIKQLIAIFIDNAIKHSNEHGVIKVSLIKQGDKKVLSIYNTGSKVRNDEKERLFERFYRSDDSRSRNTGGYGLGLAIAKSIIEYHKFRLSIDNKEGEYIKFIITMQ